MSRRSRGIFPSILRLPGAFSDPPFLPRPLFPVRDVDLPRLSALGRPDDPLPLHLLDDAGRAVETDLEAPLEHRDRSASRPGHELDRFVELLVPRRVPLLPIGGNDGDGGFVFGRALRPEMSD